jgi:hypothetical protein
MTCAHSTNTVYRGAIQGVSRGFHVLPLMVVFAAALLLGTAARGAGGDLLWENQFDAGGGFNQAFALTTRGSRVFAAGFGVTQAPDFKAQWVVRAYRGKKGELLWQDQFDKGGGFNQALSLSAQGSRVFAAGFGLTCDDPPDCNAGRTAWVVRAYDAKTGQLLWDDRFDKGGGVNQANAVAVKGSGVFAAGQGSTSTGEQEWVIRTYDKKTGELLWHDQFDKGGALSQADAIAVKGPTVLAAGSGLTCDDPPDCDSGRTEWVVRAYHARTGQLLWDEQFDAGGGHNKAEAIAVKGSRVFAAGFGSNTASQDEWLVRAYAVKTGELLWDDEFDSTGATRFFSNRAGAVAVKGSRVFAAGLGTACEDLPGCDSVTTQWLLRAYDTR